MNSEWENPGSEWSGPFFQPRSMEDMEEWSSIMAGFPHPCANLLDTKRKEDLESLDVWWFVELVSLTAEEWQQERSSLKHVQTWKVPYIYIYIYLFILFLKKKNKDRSNRNPPGSACLFDSSVQVRSQIMRPIWAVSWAILNGPQKVWRTWENRPNINSLHSVYPPFSQTQRFQSLQSWRVQTYVHLCALYGISIDL